MENLIAPFDFSSLYTKITHGHLIKILSEMIYIKNEIFWMKNFGGKTFGQIFKFRWKNFRKNFFKRKNFRTGIFSNILPNFSLRLKGNVQKSVENCFFYARYIFLNKKQFLNRRNT